MFNFLKKSKDHNIYAPVDGYCKDISECKDMTFAKKMIGDGVMIIPNDNIITSPCNGTVKMIFPTKHAFGIISDDGQEVMVHVGLETVNLNGEYFEKLVEVNQKVKAGSPVIKCDFKRIEAEGYDTSVIVVLVGRNEVHNKHTNIDVKTKDLIIER